MYIKSIVLDGFKSYGNRVEVSGFDRQFNAITGLNGTGKSNILDSICFLLGITNLSQVRAGSLQDLIYKSGQAGVNKATVSITFDNRDAAQSPPGFENFKELIVTRQIAMGGKNKYMINGTNVPNKRVQDLFCSVQLNVNNPHFLIMQGRVTKVLNMKPAEILAMVEEAAGTRMYETKRQITLKTLSKKEAKLEELNSLYTDELTPKLEKLKRERADYFEFQRAQREMEHMLRLFQAYLYYDTQRAAATAEENLNEATGKVKAIEVTISTNTKKITEIEGEITEISQELQNKAGGKLQTIEAELKTLEKNEAKAISAEKSAKESITSESKKLKQLEKDLNDDGKALEMKEKELENVKNVFQTLKDADEADSQAFNIAQKKFEAISAGMEVNDEGEAQTLQEQLMIAKQCATQANTEIKQATKELAHCQSQLKEKQKNLGANTADYERSKKQLESLEKEVQTLETALGHLNYSEQRNGELQERRRTLVAEVRAIRERIGQFEAQRPYTQFNYRDPETNFDRRSVKGVVCKLISLKERTSSTALETAAGGRLYNVVVSDDVTSKKLLQRGQLQNRTTFIPLNKIQGGQIPNNVIKLAQDLVGKENIKPALSLINYDRQLQPAMEYIFGNVFIAKDMTAARAVTFHDGIRRKCVTLQGDVTDPSGTLSGGAPQKGASVLLQLDEIRQLEAELREKEAELAAVESEIRKMSATREQYTESKRSFDRKSQELAVVRMKLQQTTHHQQQEEINTLKTKIEELTTTLHTTRTTESHHSTKATAIQARILDSTTHRDRLLKSAEADMHSAKARSTRSKQNWERREQEYETLTLEITELRAALERLRAQIAETEVTRLELEKQLQEASDTVGVVGEQCAVLRAEVKKEKEATSARSRVLRGRIEVKEKLTGENAELVLEGKRQGLVVGKCQEEYRIAKSRETEAKSKRSEHTDRDDKHLDDAREMSKKDAGELERRIKGAKDRVTKMGRTVNIKAQSMYEEEEKEYVKVVKKKKTVQEDKKSLLDVLADLDKKKKTALKLAFEQVSKDFGSIFGTLLPGSNAKLKIPEGMTILEGLEVKVSLGGVWKESLGELSGGQRSLVALSLILSMLLFKPAPLYILDEVDAALDLSHTQNIGNMLKTHFKQSQFIIVSLKDGMFNNANVLFRTKFVDGMSVVSKTVNKSR